MNPFALGVTFTPSSTEPLSPASATAGAVVPNRVQGQVVVAEVVKVQLTGADIATPVALLAPETVAVYAVPEVSGADGVNVTLVESLLSVTVPATVVEPGPVRASCAVPAERAIENWAETVDPRPTPVAPPAGVV